MLGRTDSRVRALIVLLVFVLLAGSSVVRLAYWQVVRHDDLAAMAAAQTSIRVEEPTRRGAIYDRSGTVVLAATVNRDRVAANPKLLTPERRQAVASTLVSILGLQGDAAATLTAKMTSDREYVVLARDLDPAVSDRIRSLSSGSSPALSAVLLEPEPHRVYPQSGGAPNTTLAWHLVGFVSREGVGQYGVEQFYQSQLAGSPRIVSAERGAEGRPVANTEQVVQPGSPGQDLTLTIDASLQVAVEQELLAAWMADRAKRVSAVVMDPYTGEIYAYASNPAYDANDFRAIASASPDRFMDPIASGVYEPGSVFKMVTATAAFTNHSATPTTRVVDSGTLRLDGGRTHVDDADHKANGSMQFQDAVAYSRNVAAAKIALALGRSTKTSASILFKTWQKLGFGTKTGIDVAGEVPGLVRDPAIVPWRQIDVANGAFGQGVAVTPIQLVQAYGAMMNGGMLVRPHVVKAVGEKEIEPTVAGRVVSPGQSQQLTGLLRHVIDTVPFYHDRTVVPGYEVGGKTGTAQIWDAKHGRWKINLFNYSFVGYIARQAGRPDLVVAVRVEEGTPTTIRTGLLEMPVMSFELFRRIAHD